MNVDNKDKIVILNKLYFYNLNFVFECSESLFNSLKIGWTNYIDEANSSNKKERNLEKVYKNIEKLESIEKKKINTEFLNDIKGNNIKYFEANYVDGNLKYKKKVINQIKGINYLSEMFKYIIENYIYFNNSEKKEKSSVVMLPRKKEVVEEKQSYIIDKNGYLYMNVIYENGAMILDKKSIDIEKRIYRKALQCEEEIFEKIDSNTKLSPFEKKRRIYIQSMFDLEKNLLNLEQKSIDITYPIEKYFMYSKSIVDNLYKELTSFKENKMSVLNNLMDITIKNFGCGKLLGKYDYIVSRFIKKLSDADQYIIDELYDTSIRLKQTDYMDFKNIEGMVPSMIDIYQIVNKKIIRSVGVFITDYIKNIDYSINVVTKYMSVGEVVELYFEIKNVLLNNSLSYGNRLTKYLIDLQKIVVKIIKSKTSYDSEYILNEYLKEECLF